VRMIKLIANSLEKRYGFNSVLHGINFSFSTPILGIAGSNGSGKTTLLKCITGLIKPSSGTVAWQIEGLSLSPKNIKSRLGYSAPYIQLYEELTVYENLHFLCELQNKRNINDIVTHLSLFEADSFSDLAFGNLSTGQQQRVKLAAATIKNPDILILDEPGSNLDSDGKKVVQGLVQRFRDKNKMVIIASNMEDELSLCDETLDLNKQ
jgi:ABC-type multidrug transport system ATPase subunit